MLDYLTNKCKMTNRNHLINRIRNKNSRKMQMVLIIFHFNQTKDTARMIASLIQLIILNNCMSKGLPIRIAKC